MRQNGTYSKDSKALLGQDIPLLANNQVEPIGSKLAQPWDREDAHQLSRHVVSNRACAQNHGLSNPGVHDQSGLPRLERSLLLAHNVVQLGDQCLTNKALHDATLVVLVQNSGDSFRKCCTLNSVGGLDSNIDQGSCEQLQVVNWKNSLQIPQKRL